MAQEGLLTSRGPMALVGRSVRRLRETVAMAMLITRLRIVQSFILLFVISLLLCLAAFLYGSFYYSYMPVSMFSTPVHYHHRLDCESPASFLCAYPVANVSLMRNKKHVLTFGQAYQITLQLEMPESPTNEELGMFMIRTTCFSQEGGQVASSARAARQLQSASSTRFSMLRYRSHLLRTVGTLLFLPAFLTGAAEQKQVLEVELFADYTDDPYSPSVTAVIEILSPKVQIYSSQLYVHAHFTGIRYLLFYFPIVSAMVGVSSNFIFLSVLFILSYMRLLLREEWKQEPARRRGRAPQTTLTPDAPEPETEVNTTNNSRPQDGPQQAAGTSELEPCPDTSAQHTDDWRRTHFGDITEEDMNEAVRGH